MGAIGPLEIMGEPAEGKKKEKDEGWISLESHGEDTEHSDQPLLEDGEFSLIPQEFLEESPDSPPLASDEGLYLQQKLQKLTVAQKLRLGLFGNQAVRNLLIHDSNKSVALTVLRNPKLQENEVLAIAQMKNISEDVLQGIARDKNWIKNYMVKLALVSNPKTPLGVAIRFLDHLHDRDLQNLARSRSVSSVLSRSAGRVLTKRKG